MNISEKSGSYKKGGNCIACQISFLYLVSHFVFLFFRMLDEFGNELENTDSKIDSTMKKMAKVLRMSNGE
jgi:hypothetical protein